jgi:uncharacterized protein (TIGR00297 family)
MFISVKTRKLTLSAAIAGGIIGLIIFVGAGYTGIAMLSAFFIFGTAATVWKRKEKQQSKLAKDQSTERKANQVLANAGISVITGILICVIPAWAELFRLMMAASLASAMADTLSSELGMFYGQRFYNVITLKSDRRGLDGVISLEGTLIGIAGSILIAAIYAIGFGWKITGLFVVIAGTIGNLSDSVLGALLERKHYISNDMVNFLNTFIAALTVWLCVILL